MNKFNLHKTSVLTLLLINLIAQPNFSQITYSIAITSTQVINPAAQKLTGISFDARSSGVYTIGSNSFTVGYYSPTSGTLLTGVQSAFNRIIMNGVRYPGNPEIYNWNWRYSIGPVASRTPQILGPGMPSQTLAFGFDEFMNMVQAKGLSKSEVQIMVNLYASNGEPNPALLAADWVEYCNAANDGSNPRGGVDWAAVRAANGYSTPYGVKIWNIGNEPWQPGELGNTSAGASSYTSLALPIIDSMLIVDPTIQITLAALGASNSAWNGVILGSALVGKVWGLSPHNFYDEVISTPQPSIFQCEGQLKSIAAGAKAKGLKIIVGDHAHDCPFNDQDRGMRWRGTLATADWLLMASQLDNIDRANYWIYGAPKNTWHPIRLNGNGTYTFMGLAQLYETFGTKFLDKCVLTSVVDTSGAATTLARGAAFFSNNNANANVIIVNTDTLINKKVEAPSIPGFNLQKVSLITAPTLDTDTSTTTILNPLYTSKYSLPIASVLLFEYQNITTNITANKTLANEFTLYPNPTNTTLYLSKAIDNVSIYNLLGEKVFENKGINTSISVAEFDDGIYVLRSNNYPLKFIVNH
ncbi:MAG: T9SS type A sorting domain-containing protein [Sphingobacteriaceae bacterium]|nr:T9SS type A sorting domain-containing protein [Sphingobacteriaceae bacterium]